MMQPFLQISPQYTAEVSITQTHLADSTNSLAIIVDCVHTESTTTATATKIALAACCVNTFKQNATPYGNTHSILREITVIRIYSL